MRMKPVLVLLIAIVATVVPIAISADGNVIHVNLIHRHGARTKPFIQGAILNWADVVLSQQGAVMALALGKFINEQYGPNSSVGLLPMHYDMDKIVSRTTDFERTIRTGVGMLRGIYDGETEIPFLYHKPSDYDYMLGYFYSWPSAVLREEYINTFNAMNDQRTLQIVNQTTLNAIGDVIGTTICPTQQTLCALAGEDIATCDRSNGGLPPLLNELIQDGQLFRVQSESFAFQYLYNSSDRYWRNTGPYGRLLALEWITNAKMALNGSNTEAVMHHYSAHDITIYGFFVALGVVNASTTDLRILIPSFTSVVIGELFPDGSIKLKYGRQDQDYGSGYGYQLYDDHLRMGCINSNNVTYYSQQCPLEELERFVDTMAPEAPDATCYADPANAAQTGCDQMGVVPTNAHCIRYRKNCGFMACQAPYVLDRTTWGCMKVNARPPVAYKSLSAGAGVAIAASSTLIGVVAGAFMALCSKKYQEQRSEPLMA